MKPYLLLFILTFFIPSQALLLQANDICDECEEVWSDPYWGIQCCDSAWDQWGFDCEYMENEYGWDCTGCNCPYDNNPDCGDGFCTGDENINICPSDCTANGCNTDNQVDDCADGDCCPESWIGDGYADCEDPNNFGCDLSCYDYDGGDCPEPNTGDINEDEVIDIFDVIIIVDIILSNIEPTEYELWASDLNGDGINDIFDIINIVGIILN